MIQSKDDYLYYLEADRVALGREKWNWKSAIFDDVWNFERLLRKLEYYANCRQGSFVLQLLYWIYYYRFHKVSTKLNFTIPINTFGPGLSIAHIGTIVVNRNARMGANCRIHVCTSIASSAGDTDQVPKLGNNIYIGPGAKLFGDIIIADNIAIGANSVVNKSFLEPNITIAGVPAKKISSKGSNGLLIKYPDI
jgi:serine O-acetyltransferase